MIRHVAVAALLAVGCGGHQVFKLSGDENNAYELERVLGRRQLPPAPTPVNRRGPRVYAVVAGSGPAKTIVTYDITSGNVVWKADADLQSRIAAGGDFIAAVEGKQLVARDADSGQPRWRAAIDGAVVGVTADRDRVYAAWGRGSDAVLVGYDGRTGDRVWKSAAAGALGAPTAHGGLVLVPYLRQWLSIVDGATGKQLTRIRGIDREINTIVAGSRAAYFGSPAGMIELDARAASGRRSDATLAAVKLPPQLDGTTYGIDAYDAVQTSFTANDRKRILWASTPTTSGPMQLAHDGYVVHYFRFVFGFGLDGGMRWAYSHPRVELIASQHTGAVIAAVSLTGEVVAIDPRGGALIVTKQLGVSGPLIGATLDAEGWSPPSRLATTAETVAALISIARDRDARFDRVKDLAVKTLAKLPGGEVTRALLAVLADPRQPIALKDAVVELLIERRDAASLPVLTEQLAVKADFLAGTEPLALAPVARAIGGLADVAVDPAQAAKALAALADQLDSPATEPAELVLLIRAMVAIGKGSERAQLTSHLLLYHADDLADDAGWQRAIVAAVAGGGAQERELLRYVAGDPRTRPGLVTAIRDLAP